jgi:hypothetical protein
MDSRLRGNDGGGERIAKLTYYRIVRDVATAVRLKYSEA